MLERGADDQGAGSQRPAAVPGTGPTRCHPRRGATPGVGGCRGRPGGRPSRSGPWSWVHCLPPLFGRQQDRRSRTFHVALRHNMRVQAWRLGFLRQESTKRPTPAPSPTARDGSVGGRLPTMARRLIKRCWLHTGASIAGRNAASAPLGRPADDVPACRFVSGGVTLCPPGGSSDARRYCQN